MTRIVITGGGTGGHLYPALAVAEALQDENDILYIGNESRAEAHMVPQLGIDFAGLTFSGMPRTFNLSLFRWFFQLFQSFFEARSILSAFKPHVVFATGGYVTAPVLLAAKSLKIPFVLHEPDAHPGLVNRRMAPWAATITCAFDAAKTQLRTNRVVVTGNPLRSQIGNLSRREALQELGLAFQLDKPILLVTGGSQGARRLNEAALAALPTLIETLHLQIIHQTGEKLYAETLNQCPIGYQAHPAYFMTPYITDMAATLALADMALCRSGSMSLSELYQARVPALLVPYPHASANHQYENALAAQQAGAAVLIPDAELDGDRLLTTLMSILGHAETLDTMQAAAAALSRPNATQDVAEIVQSVADICLDTVKKLGRKDSNL